MKYKRAHRVPWRIVQDKAVLVSVKNSELMALNKTGTDIWAFLETEKNLDEIVEYIFSKYDIQRQKAEQDVKSFIEKMTDKKVLDLI